MKVIIIGLMLILSSVEMHAQGTISFSNRDTSRGLDAPFFLWDGSRLAGNGFMAEILGGSSHDNMVPIATAGFLTGADAGYFNGGIQSVPGVLAGQTAFLLVHAWDTSAGATFNDAVQSGLRNVIGISTVFTVTAGDVANPSPLLGLTSVTIGSIPEPSGLALLLGGYSALRFIRNKAR